MRVALTVLAALCLAAACKKKFEIIPDGAKQVTREDKTETRNDLPGAESEATTVDVSLREYKFILAEQLFLCEAREFSDATKAIAAAKKTIAERPQEEQKNDKAYFALSGRSVWLRTGRQLVWCMLSSGQNAAVNPAMQQLREVFLKKFHEAI